MTILVIDISLYAKGFNEPKYQFLINAGMKHLNDQKAFIEY